MKKFTLVLSIGLLSMALSGCGGSENPEENEELLRQSFQNFSIDIPENWRKVPSDSFANTVPQETVALFVNRVDGSEFIQNVSVVKESINTDASSLEYAKANILLGSKAIVDYRKISDEEMTINSTPTTLHLFRARNATADVLRHYTQAYFARDRIGYTVTCIAQEDNPVQQQSCTRVVSSFRFAN